MLLVAVLFFPPRSDGGFAKSLNNFLLALTPFL